MECSGDVPLPPGRRVGGISPCITLRKASSTASKANATWDNGKVPAPRTKNMRLKNDLLGVSLHSAKDAMMRHDDKRIKMGSLTNTLNRKPSFLKDDPEVNSLLKMLQTTTFVGEIDPVHHARYMIEPEEETPGQDPLFDLTELEKTSISIMASYNSDEHLLSAMQASKRELSL